MTELEHIAAVPAAFSWLAEPARASLEGEVLTLSAGPRTDWFVDPGSGTVTLNAPAAVCTLEGDFSLSARVAVDFATTFDAGALVLWDEDRCWAKLAFEMSPQRRPMVVSVITKGESDDCNSAEVTAGYVWLRVSRLGKAHAFHASHDGQHWLFVRHFRLNGSGEARVGFEAQSPTGDGCRAHFSDISYSPGALRDLRDGS
jgi:uncharacterized protein